MGSVESVQFQIVPCSSLYFSRSIGPFQCSQCQLQGFNLLHLSLPNWFTLFILASSVCNSLRCLISALTLGCEGGHLFRLSCSVMLWGGRNFANITGMCGECSQCLGHTGFATAHCMCAFPVYTARLQVALQGNCLKWALCCQYFPGLSQIQVLGYFTKADSVQPAFSALPRSEQLRWPGA